MLCNDSVDAYGTLVSARLYVPSDLSSLTHRHLKISHQRHLTDDGSHPLPIYCAIRHELPNLKELEDEQEQLSERMKKSFGGGSGKQEKEKERLAERRKELVAREGRWMWFEVSPYGTIALACLLLHMSTSLTLAPLAEVGCDELGAWIPTWALGRLFENGKSTERTPELSLTVMSG